MIPNFVFYDLIGQFKRLLPYTWPINVLLFSDYYTVGFFYLNLSLEPLTCISPHDTGHKLDHDVKFSSSGACCYLIFNL